jgi:hypothetical protein
MAKIELPRGYRLFVAPRGGGRNFEELQVTSASFGRAIESTSTAKCTARASRVTRPDLIGTWITELAIYDIEGELVWCGPITDIVWDKVTDELRLQAADLSTWFDRTPCGEHDFSSNQAADLATILVAFVQDAINYNPGIRLSVHATTCGVAGNRRTRAIQHVLVKDAISELARSGVDWTVVGRQMLIGAEIPANTITITEDDWTLAPTVHERGNSLCTIAVVDGTGVVGYAEADPSLLITRGRIMRKFPEPKIRDQASADEAARGRISMLGTALWVEPSSGAKLRPSAPVSIGQLVPGAKVIAGATYRGQPFRTEMRLESISVDCMTNDVVPVLQPLGEVAK